MQDQEIAVRVERVVKRFDTHVAVDGVSFDVRRGSVFGLLGPNGAGKTTTIRMIMNIIAPDEGSIEILGKPLGETLATTIGYLPEERGLYRKMKVLDHTIFLGEIRGLSRAEARRRAEQWLVRLDLESWSKKKVEDLSKGMQQKIQFVGCVIHDPEILILDEPFSGLDPVNARLLKELFLEFRDRGKTLIFSTHVMEQAEKLCDEIALINRAKVVLHGAVQEIRNRYSPNRLLLRGSADPEPLRRIAGVRDLKVSNGLVDVELDPATPRAVFLREVTAVWPLESAVPHETSL
ncbi:MAG TPA: ATP-binding cassette domain-containing protein, partial [Thermoanaerobaculia bacterium]|nr:ATP-binding cassette domain-containing protein [Thermoanaerobaculia bacterium]